jgi:hypothetical protein
MSIWTDLLSLHGYVTPARTDGARSPKASAPQGLEEADRLRELIGCPSAGSARPEPRGPLLGVRGLT